MLFLKTEVFFFEMKVIKVSNRPFLSRTDPQTASFMSCHFLHCALKRSSSVTSSAHSPPSWNFSNSCASSPSSKRSSGVLTAALRTEKKKGLLSVPQENTACLEENNREEKKKKSSTLSECAIKLLQVFCQRGGWTLEKVRFCFWEIQKKTCIPVKHAETKNMADWKISHGRVITAAIRKSFA